MFKHKLLLGGALWLLFAPPVLAQRFPRVANTLADMVASNPNVVHTNIFVTDQKRGGMFYWLAGSTVVTNSGTIYPTTYPAATGRYFRQFQGPLNAGWFGALGDGTDQTAPIKNAYDLIDKSAGGDIYFPPGNYSFNLAITNRNIGLIFDSFIKEDSGVPVIVSNIITAANIALPIITIGDGTNFAKGSRIIGGTFKGNGSSGVLLRLAGGAYECLIDGAQFYNAQTNIWIEGTGTLPCSVNRFVNGSCLAANVDNSRGFYVAAPSTGSSFTTASSFVSYHFNGQLGAANARLGELDGTSVSFSDVHVDFIIGSPIRFTHFGGSFANNPVIYCSDVILDGSSTWPILEDEYGAAQRISAFLVGSFTFNGQTEMQDGTILTQEKCQATTMPGGQYAVPNMNGPVAFDRIGSTTNRTWNTLEANDSDPTIFQLSATNGTMELLGRTNISLAAGGLTATNRVLYVQPNQVVVTNSALDISSLKVYGAGAGIYSDTNAPTVRVFTAGVSNSVRSALHLDSYQNTPAFPISLDFGLMNSTNGAFTSRIVHYGNVNTNRETELQIQTHNITNGTWNTNLTLTSVGVGISALGRLLPALPLDVDGSAQIRGANLNVRGVTYAWPSINAAGSLTNDGAGNLAWGLVTGGGSGGGATNAYNQIEDEGATLTQRTTIDFVGPGVTVTDVGGETRVTIPGDTGGITNAITDLNGQTNATQTLVEGGFTSSSSITSAGGIHTFNTSTNFPGLSITNNMRIGLEYLTSTNPAINLSTQGSKFWTLTNNAVPTFAGTPTGTDFAPTVTIMVTNTGSFTIDWPNTIYWPPTDTEVNPMASTITSYVFKWDGQQIVGYGDAVVGAGGTVTSVAMTVPGGFSVTGSPVTTNGTFAVEANGEQPYYFLRGNFDGSSTWDNTLIYSNANNTVSATFGSAKRGRTGDATGSPASGGILGQYRVGGWNTASYVLGGGLEGYATENWTATANGTELRLNVVSNTTAVSSLAMTIGQDRRVKLASASTANSFLGTDGDGFIVITNAPAGGGGSPATAWQTVGSGSDYILTTSFAKVDFGGTDPTITLTNAGTYQVMCLIAASSSATFPQHYYWTNITDGTSVAGTLHDINVSSMEAPLVMTFQYTTTAANKVLELWGSTDNITGAPSVDADRTVIDVIRLDDLAGSGGSGNMTHSGASALSAIAGSLDTSGLNWVSRPVFASTNGNITIGDGTQATHAITFNGSGTDVAVAYSSGQLDAGTGTTFRSGNLVASAATGSATVGTGGFIVSGLGSLTWPASGIARLQGPAGTNLAGLHLGPATTNFPYLGVTNQSIHILLGDRTTYTDVVLGDLTATDNIQAGAGLATAPSFAFGPDPDTGMYNAAPNLIGFAANGAAVLQVGPNSVAHPTGNWILSSNGDGTFVTTVFVGSTNVAGALATKITASSTDTLTNKTLDAAATGNVLKQTKYLLFQRPDYGDGVGAIPQTNNYTASGLMHFTFSGSAETNANWVVYEADVPPDIDTSVAMTATLAFASGGTDADDVTFHVTYALGAAGTTLPSGTAIATSPIVMTVTPTTPAAGDVQTTSAVTLTGWAASMTAGTPLFIRVARLNNTNDDTARDMYLRIAYGSTL